MLVQDELARPIIAAMKASDDRLRTASGRKAPFRNQCFPSESLNSPGDGRTERVLQA